MIEALLNVWWALIPFTLLVIYAIWELSRKRERESEERGRKLEEEVEELRKENLGANFIGF